MKFPKRCILRPFSPFLCNFPPFFFPLFHFFPYLLFFLYFSPAAIPPDPHPTIVFLIYVPEIICLVFIKTSLLSTNQIFMNRRGKNIDSFCFLLVINRLFGYRAPASNPFGAAKPIDTAQRYLSLVIS